MKTIKGNTGAKIVALILFIISAATLLLSGLGISQAFFSGAYELELNAFEQKILEMLCNDKMYEVLDVYEFYSDYSGPIFTEENSNFRINVFELTGDRAKGPTGEGREIPLYIGYKGEDTIYESVKYTQLAEFKEGHTGRDPLVNMQEHRLDLERLEANPNVKNVRSFRFEGYILPLTENDDIAENFRLASFIYVLRYDFIIAAGASLLLCILLFAFLLAAAGHKNNTEGIYLSKFDEIPFDLLSAVMAFIGFWPISLGISGFNYARPPLEHILFFIAGWTGTALIGMVYLTSLAARLKAGKLMGLLKSCLIYKLWCFCRKWIKKGLNIALSLFKRVPEIAKPFIIFVSLLFIEFLIIILNIYEGDNILLWWIISRLVLLPLFIYLLLCLKKINTGAKELARGNDSFKIDTRYLYGPIKQQAESLNNIGAGIGKAVEERMKSERFRTELITNVSHDIKTPLTSIVNYVDLMEKEKPENEKMREYLAILSRQSGKLKKLIEDLVEASKASSGSLSVNLQKMELGVLLDQTAGEYGEKLEEKNLSLVLTKPEEKVEILADGRHMWRIFDNLMNNIVKYSLPGTRVYLELQKKEAQAIVSFKNISREQLNIDAAELAERFVRGDRSRNTEGSGLGLSIAQSLVKLQNGEMEIKLDGDLFKIELKFNTI